MKTQETIVSNLIEESWAKAMSYVAYRQLVEKLAKNGKSTGPLQTDAYVNYTALNHRRMKRWDKTLKFDGKSIDKIKSVDVKMNWVVLTESWCGDASPALPVMHKITQINHNISLKVLLRDHNLELMNLFLTNGSLSIPKLIAFNPINNNIIGTWGPRSTKATQLVETFKSENGALTADFKESLQIWYNKDKGQSILEDLLELLPLK